MSCPCQELTLRYFASSQVHAFFSGQQLVTLAGNLTWFRSLGQARIALERHGLTRAEASRVLCGRQVWP